MFKKDYSDYIEDMLQACIDIEEALKLMTFNEFKKDNIRLRAIERLFEIIGEAANRIPKDLQEKYSDIPWKKIIGMRNIIIHTYEKVDASTLWNAAKNDLNNLKNQLDKICKDINK